MTLDDPSEVGTARQGAESTSPIARKPIGTEGVGDRWVTEAQQ
jgi:hypothetical protein